MTKIIDANLSSELRKSFIDYGLSVIISRALPDVRDGLKPVHRRILFSMHENGFDKQGPFRKSARVVGDVIGKYHPHGDSAIYDSMVRMAQNFSMAVPLIDGQGNFGSIDGDPAAAMRYTEARMTEAAGFLLQDIEKNTVDFRDNYDGSEREPIVLPARFPNILVNGTEGIAVGMATSIAPHNMSEVLKATLGLLDRPDISVEELAGCLEGPDFPTGGIISGREAVRQVYLTGKGTINVRARHHIEDGKRGRRAIVFTEMPYQVNKAKVVEHIGALAAEKKLDGIAEVRDESDREGIRLVVELRADADADAVLARLHKLTALRGTFSQNLLALRDGRPQSMNLKEILEAFLEFRREVVRRRTAWFLRKARARAHIVIGLLMALGTIDKVIAAIRASKTQAEALQSLMSLSLPLRGIEELYKLIETKGGSGKVPARAHLSETQARAILEMRLQRLVGLERDKLANEASTLIEEISRLVAILREPGELTMVIRRELEEMLALHPGERRTSVEDEVQEISRDILVPRTEEFVTISHQGYVKRVPAARAEKETGDTLKDGDFIVRAFAASSRTPLLFFTEKGQAYKISVWQLPEPGPQNRGRPIVNLFDIPTGERIVAVLPCPEERDAFLKTEIAFVTRSGHIRRNALEEFLTVPNGGKMAMKFEDGEKDGILDVFVAPEESDVLFLTRAGMALRFSASEIRLFSGRGSKGVRGIKLKDDDEVVSAMTLARNCTPAEAEAFLALVSKERGLGQEVSNGETVGDLPSERAGELKAAEQIVFTVTENGHARLASAYSYRTARRGGQGVMDKSRAKKTGALAGGAVVTENRIVLITERGKTLEVDTGKARFAARGAAGNVIAKLDSGDRIALLSP